MKADVDIRRAAALPEALSPLALCEEVVKLRLVPGRVVFGHYYGHARPDSRLGQTRQQCGFVPHCWIEDEASKQIFDPNRWRMEFSGTKPYVYVCDLPSKDYDMGGNRLRGKLRPMPPEYCADERQFELPGSPLLELFDDVLGGLSGQATVSIGQVHYVATQNPRKLAPVWSSLHSYLLRCNELVLVPQDNFEWLEANGE